MSKESRQRQREARKRPRKRRFRWLVPVVVIVCIAASVFAWIQFQPKPNKIVVTAIHEPSQPRTLNELLALSPADLDKCDVGLMNLLCADGLPGAENLDVQNCLKTLDGLALRVKFETDRHFYRFREHPEQFRNSLGYYRMMMLDQVLVEGANGEMMINDGVTRATRAAMNGQNNVPVEVFEQNPSLNLGNLPTVGSKLPGQP